MATFPYSPNLPPTWTTISTSRRNNLFYNGDTLSFILNKTGATNYEVCDYYGNIVETGTLSGTNITLSTKPLGWYRMYITGPTSHADYGTMYGSTQFSIIESSSNFPTNAAPGTSGSFGYGAGGDNIIHGVMAMGPQRYNIGNAADPTSDPNGLTIFNTQRGRTLDASWYNNPDYADPVRPRPAFVAFPNGTSSVQQQAGVTQTVEALYPSIENFEGPSNEPVVNAALVPAMQTFYEAVKAGNSNAQVLGPCPVTVNNNAANIDSFLGAGGGDYVDALSIHTYNCTNGDIALGRRTFTQLKQVLDAHNFTKPIWQTENGFLFSDYGVFQPQRARWVMLQYLQIEQILGIPKERFSYFYDISHGFWDFPSFWELADTTLVPFQAQMRVFSAELYGKTYTSALDFGEVGNNMYIGSVYTNSSTGDKVIALMSGGVQDSLVRFSVVAPEPSGTLTAIDCFGNTREIEYQNNFLQLSLVPDLQYIRLPEGVSLVVFPVVTAQNLLVSSVAGTSLIARNGQIVGSGSTSNLQLYGRRIANDIYDNPYYYDQAGVNGTYGAFRDDTGSLPAWVGVRFNNTQYIDRIIIFGTQPWQQQGTLLDFDVQTLAVDSDTWTTQHTYSQSPVSKYAPNNYTGTGCTYDQWDPNYCIWDLALTPISCRGIRVYVRGLTYGQFINLETVNASVSSPGTSSNKITLREIMVFSEQTAVPRVAVENEI